MGHFSKFVGRGSRRIAFRHRGDTERDGSALDDFAVVPRRLELVGFETPEGKTVLVVLNRRSQPETYVVRDGARSFDDTIPAHGIKTYIY